MSCDVPKLLQPTILNHSLCNCPLPFSPLEVSHFFPTLERYDRRNPFRFALRCVSACIKELRRAWETQRFRAKGVPKISSPNFLPQKEASKNDQPNKNTQILSPFFPFFFQKKVQLHPRETRRKFQQKQRCKLFSNKTPYFTLVKIHPSSTKRKFERFFLVTWRVKWLGRLVP